MQLRFAARLTSETYVSERGWRLANLDRCPAHPGGGCSFRRHTPYERKWPIGAKIPRWYCPEAHATFSLLPDFLASHLPGPLVEIEAVAAAVEAGPTVEAVASELRPDIELPGAVRWVRRRLRWFREAVSVARGLLEVLAGVELRPSAVGRALSAAAGTALVCLRAQLCHQLGRIAAPTGLSPRWRNLEIAEVDFNNRRGQRARAGPT